jgi:hypothetical protein
LSVSQAKPTATNDGDICGRKTEAEGGAEDAGASGIGYRRRRHIG